MIHYENSATINIYVINVIVCGWPSSHSMNNLNVSYLNFKVTATNISYADSGQLDLMNTQFAKPTLANAKASLEKYANVC